MPSSASARPNGTSSNVNQSQFGSSAASSHQAAAGSGTFHDHDDDELGDEDEEAIDASKSTEPLIVVAVVGRENAAAMALLADARGSQLVQTWAHEMVDDTMRAPWLLFIGSLEYELPEFIRLKARQSDLRIRWARLNLTAHSWRCLACRNVLWCTIDGRLTYARGCPKCEAKGEICYWRGEAIDSCEACVTGKAFCGAGGRVNAKFTDDFVDYLDHHFGLGRDPSSSTWEASNFRYAQPFLDEFKHCRVLKSHLRAMKGSEAASRVPPELPKERATAPTKPTDEEIAKWVARTQHLSEEADYYDGQMATVARNSGRCSRALLPAGQLQDPIPAYPFTHIRGSLAYRYIQYPECVPKIVMADSRRASLLAIEHSHAGPQPFVKPPLPSRYDQRKPTAMAANTSLNSLGKRFVRDDDEEEDDDHDSIVSSSPASISPRLLPLRRPAKAKIESTRATIRATKTEEWWEKPGDGLNLLHAGKNDHGNQHVGRQAPVARLVLSTSHEWGVKNHTLWRKTTYPIVERKKCWPQLTDIGEGLPVTVIEGGDRIVLTIPDCKPEKLEVTCVGLKSGPARLELLPTALSEYFIQPLSASPHAIAVLSTYRIAIRQRKSSFNAYRPQGQVVAAPWERVLKLFAEWASVEAPQIFAIRYMEKPHADAKELYGFLACVQSCGARLPMFFSGPSSNWHVAPPGPPTLHQQWGGRPANLLGAPIELDGIAATKSTSMDLIPWANHSKSGDHKNLRWMTRARARR